jgi:hypothetical protein
MKFSEQVLLGSTLIKFTANHYLFNNCGCLIGMAGASQGETCFDQIWLSTGGWSDGLVRMCKVFPWLEADQKVRDVRGNYNTSPRMAINRSAEAIRDGWASFEQVLVWLQTTIDPIQEAWDKEPVPVEVPETCVS